MLRALASVLQRGLFYTLRLYLSSDASFRGGPAERAAAEERERLQRQGEQEAERLKLQMQEEAEQRRQEALAAAEELKKKVWSMWTPNAFSKINVLQIKAKPRTPPPVDEAAERERAALGDKISQLQERMRQRKEELAKQKESESQAAASGPSLSELEKQKMEKMRQFIAQARDAKGIPPGQSALSGLSKPSMLAPLGGVAEGLFVMSVSPTELQRCQLRSAFTGSRCIIMFTTVQVAAKNCWNLLVLFVPHLHYPHCDRL